MAWPDTYARPRPGLNHVLSYGQSLSNGWEGWPALSTEPVAGAFMLGESVRPVSEHAPVWEVLGEPVLNPLVATVQDIATGVLLPSATVAALPPGALALGETVLEGAIAEWRHRGGVPPDHEMLASACGVGGRPLEALVKGAEPEQFNRLRGCVRLAREIAQGGGRDYQIAALLFLQGENNSRGLGGTSERDAYKAMLTRFYADFVADIAAVAAGQGAPPTMFLYQTGGLYASEDNAIAQAQLEVALEIPLCFLAAPSYPVTDKGGHLDANGYRWLGAQFGKVMHRVLTLGERWRPLHPVAASGQGRELRIDFSVPAPPLAWGRPFAGQSRHVIAQRGFSVLDAAGRVPITEVALDGPDRVLILLDRPMGAGAVVRYASATHGGLGALQDSDDSASVLSYIAEGGSRPPAGPDIARLVGQPYSLRNWCVAFAIPVGPG
jgi:hypothetical protein